MKDYVMTMAEIAKENEAKIRRIEVSEYQALNKVVVNLTLELPIDPDKSMK